MPAVVRNLFTSHCFVALCAVTLTLETAFIADVPMLRPAFYAFVFFATWSSYRLHDLRRAATRWRTIGLLIATLIAGLSLPPTMLPWIALSTVLSVAYSLPLLPGGRRLREFGIAKILSLVAAWTLVTAYLPAQHLLDAEQMTLLLLRRFFFIFALCLAFDARDRQADARAGIRTLPVRLGEGGSVLAIRVALIAFAGLAVITPLFGGLHHPAMPVAIALLASAIASWFAIEHARRRSPGTVYYLSCVDGMMAAQGVAVALSAWLFAAR